MPGAGNGSLPDPPEKTTPENGGQLRKTDSGKKTIFDSLPEMFPKSNARIKPEEANTELTAPAQMITNRDERHLCTAWIKKNIQKKECCNYAEDEREEICKCGYPKVHHADGAIKPTVLRESWDKHQHVCEVPTDAFGDISFGRGIMGKYVRVSTNTSSETIYELMTEQWRLHPPNLLISVTGGAKNFYMKSRLKEVFRRGLIKVAQTTGAWIVTGGTHTGVMKHVGIAIRDYTMSSTAGEAQVVAIGIASWGIVHNREPLVHPEGRFPAHYSLDERGQGRLSCLDINHSHFILVDDGTHGQYGVEIELRAHLEKHISQQPLSHKESGVKIPAVCVVLEGGPGTLNTMYSAILNGTPCVVLEGSGRIADVVAKVANLPASQVTLALIHRLMKRFFGKEYETFSKLKIIEWTKKIQDIIRMPHLLTIFCVDKEGHGDVDVAILEALLKASRHCSSPGRESWEQQLELAVAWNRVDIAESEIFTEESHWKSSDLHPAMFSACTNHKPEFVKLLLENGVCLREFLDEDTLCQLYAHLQPGCLAMHRLAKYEKLEREGQMEAAGPKRVSLCLVSELVRHFLGSYTELLYPQTTELANRTFLDDVRLTFSPRGAAEHKSSFSTEVEKVAQDARDPERDMFLWAILQNDKDMADIAWEQCRDSITAALAASKILKRMAEEEEYVGDEAVEMRNLANYYEKQATGVFSECHNRDEQRAQKLLTRTSPSWGRTTCLRLALEADDKIFVAHSGVQALLTRIWFGELAVTNPRWKVILCLVFTPLIYTGFISFRRDEDINRESERESKFMESVKGHLSDSGWKTLLRFYPHNMDLQPLDCFTRFTGFLTAPVVKFCWNIVSYFCFLLLFGVVLVIDFQTTPSWTELLLYVWLLSLVCEEVRQLFDDPDGFTFRRKVKLYIRDLWNILDVLSLSIFIPGLVCRLTTTAFYAGKVILCVDFIVFCLRFMAIFTISRTLGPKIIIVRRMVMDMFFFLFLLSIWVVAFGVAKQGILIENENRLNWILRGILYEPYLIIFGTIPSDIDNTVFDITTCTTDGSDPMKPRCPVLGTDQTPVFPGWLTIILLCIYLLFANILLLNLLIAIFNYTFQEVQDNTDCIWKFQRYELIKEYQSRPALPPPLILLSHLYLLFIHLLSCCCHNSSQNEFKEELPQWEEEEVLSWEALMKENYLAKTQEERSQSMEQRIKDTANKVGEMMEFLQGEQSREAQSVMQRLIHLEDQVLNSTKALCWITNALRSQGFQSDEELSFHSLTTSNTESDLCRMEDETAGEGVQYHTNARQLQYPGSTVTRFPVPDEKVPWEVEFTEYMPPIYNAQGTEASQKNDPPQTGDSVIADLNKYRNPAGRTGLMGRGCLDQLGPNQILEPVITRWQEGDSPVLEFLAVWEELPGQWTLPGGQAQTQEPLPGRLQRLLGKKVYEKIRAWMSTGDHVRMVYAGYVDDSRNTDNAWVETTSFNLHLERNNVLLAELNHMVKSMAVSEELFWWKEVGSTTLACVHHTEILRQVSELQQGTF